MRHLHVEWETSDSDKIVCLMQGAEEIPVPPSEYIDNFLRQGPGNGRLAEESDIEMLTEMFPELPAEAKLCLDGLTKFGARNMEDARRAAFEAIHLNPSSRIAQQFVGLVLVKAEVRCQIGVLHEPSVADILRMELPETRKYVFRIVCERYGAEQPREIRDALLVLTDVAPFDHDRLAQITKACRSDDRPFVVVATEFEGALLESPPEPNVFLVAIRPNAEENLSEVFDDLAIASGARTLSVEFGFGLPAKPEIVERGLILPGVDWGSVDARDLGAPGTIRFEAGYLALESATPDRFQERIVNLRNSIPFLRTSAEVQAIRSRLARFGVNDLELPFKPCAEQELQSTPTLFPLATGFKTPYFMTDLTRSEACLDSPRVLIADFPLYELPLVMTALAETSKRGHSLVVVAPIIRGAALPLLLINKIRGIAACLAIETNSTSMMQQLASFCGAKVLRVGDENRLNERDVIASLGRVHRVISTRSLSEFYLEVK